MTCTHPLQRPGKFQHNSIVAAGWHRGPDKYATRPRGASIKLCECKYCEHGSITDHDFPQLSQLDPFPDLGIAGNLQIGQVPGAAGRDGNGFTLQKQWSDVTPSSPVGMSDFCRLSPADTNPYAVISIKASAATKTTGDGQAQTVLEKSVRKRYGITCQAHQRLMTTAAVLMLRKR